MNGPCRVRSQSERHTRECTGGCTAHAYMSLFWERHWRNPLQFPAVDMLCTCQQMPDEDAGAHSLPVLACHALHPCSFALWLGRPTLGRISVPRPLCETD